MIMSQTALTSAPQHKPFPKSFSGLSSMGNQNLPDSPVGLSKPNFGALEAALHQKNNSSLSNFNVGFELNSSGGGVGVGITGSPHNRSSSVVSYTSDFNENIDFEDAEQT